MPHSTPLALGEEHRATEALLKASGISYVLLRNGCWYTQNYAASIAPALAHYAFIGTVGEGRIASAAREDYAAGEQVEYVNLPQAEFAAALKGTGLPDPFADLLAVLYGGQCAQLSTNSTPFSKYRLPSI